jgi:hypothetical protein
MCDDLRAPGLARAVPGVGPALEVARNRLPAPAVPSVSLVSGDLRHSWACGWLQRGGMCDCGAVSWLRGFDYDRLVELLAEGWYEQDQPQEGMQE